ncbi:uncharacterized protein LOC142231916 isoform X2 [Haematobia irritans]|uniref:uncharacterized protein LOC142231916 isoform X2 n=1 Tax=Haematobia irritans TaxID=7368 RepID=UPI003F4FB7BE
METTTTIYDDRPISMYDNLNMTSNVNTTSTPKIKQLQPASSATTSAARLPASKTNGEVHTTTPFTDITFKFNDNNNTKLHSPLAQYQQQPHHTQLNGNGNLNQIPTSLTSSSPQPPPNTATSPVYATPFKMANTSITKPAITTTNTTITTSSPLISTSPPSPPPHYHTGIMQHHNHTPPAATGAGSANIGNAFASSKSPLLPSTTSSPSTFTSHTPSAAVNSTATANDNDIRLHHERPLSQHSQSELNDTSHSIAAVKAALNEAKSKFFGLNGYATQQHPYDPHESQMQNLLPNIGTASANRDKVDAGRSPSNHQKYQPQLQPTKPQPKYQNIPENSAIFRNQTQGVIAPELPPKPVEYQNLNKTSSPSPTVNNNNNKPMDHSNNRKLPDGTTYNQISLNDIDGPSNRSQTVYMATTVPQNIKEIKHPNPMGFRQPNLARWLLILQIIIGILLLSLSTWIFVLSPNTPIQDNPYWCGLALLIAGIIGLILVRYHRIKRDKTREHCFIFLRMDSYVLALLSLLLCCVALIFAAIHYCRITAPDTRCESVHMLIEHGSCVCTFNAPNLNHTSSNTNSTDSMTYGSEQINSQGSDELPIDNSYKFEYRDLSCEEVSGDWTTILGLSFIINSVGFIVSFTYMILLACCRSATKRSYTTVRTSTF